MPKRNILFQKEDFVFLKAFTITFIFNPVGFFASISLYQNEAGKHGSITGYGLSLTYWSIVLTVIFLLF